MSTRADRRKCRTTLAGLPYVRFSRRSAPHAASSSRQPAVAAEESGSLVREQSATALERSYRSRRLLKAATAPCTSSGGIFGSTPFSQITWQPSARSPRAQLRKYQPPSLGCICAARQTVRLIEAYSERSPRLRERRHPP